MSDAHSLPPATATANAHMTTTAIQLRFNDIDMAGHAHNAVYLSWFEQARMDLLRTFIERKHDWKVHGLIVALIL